MKRSEGWNGVTSGGTEGSRQIQEMYSRATVGDKEGQVSKETSRTSLVTQWLRIHLPMQGTRVRALVREDPTCCGATKPMCHNY